MEKLSNGYAFLSTELFNAHSLHPGLVNSSNHSELTHFSLARRLLKGHKPEVGKQSGTYQDFGTAYICGETFTGSIVLSLPGPVNNCRDVR